MFRNNDVDARHSPSYPREWCDPYKPNVAVLMDPAGSLDGPAGRLDYCLGLIIHPLFPCIHFCTC